MRKKIDKAPPSILSQYCSKLECGCFLAVVAQQSLLPLNCKTDWELKELVTLYR